MLEIKNLINGRWTNSASGKTLLSTNPADSTDILARVPASTKEDIDEAVLSARNAYPSWSAMPAPKRGEILYRTAETLKANKDALASLVTREMGKILPEGAGDAQEAIDMAYYMAGEGRRLYGETVPSELKDKDCKSIREPIGVFGLITPWNFPIAIPSWKVLPALICGNTVVLKPSSLAPLCATRFVEALVSSGLPPGVVNLVHGTGIEAGEPLAMHPGIDGVSFTGSSTVGERLAKAAFGSSKAVSCEMGGKNPMLVMADADIDLAIEGALWGAFGTTGQRCTATSRIIVHEKVHDDFVERLVRAAKKLKLGDGSKPGVHMGPLISEAQADKVMGLIEAGVNEGARLECGGKRLSGEEFCKGAFIEPTIFTGVAPSMRIAREEIFGPVASVIKAGSYEEAVKIANSSDFGLSSSIYTRDARTSARAEKDLDSGIVYINAPTIGAEIQLPFGGIKRSGIGHREAGGRGGSLDTYSRWKVVFRDFSGRLQRAQID